MISCVMQPSVFLVGNQHKVFQAIVCFVMVAMMDDFFCFKMSSKMLFHDNAVFKNIVSTGRGMARSIDQPVALKEPSSTTPI